MYTLCMYTIYSTVRISPGYRLKFYHLPPCFITFRPCVVFALFPILYQAMKSSTLFAAALVTLILANPSRTNKRQLNGLLASVEGVLGIDQTFDYIVVGGGYRGLDNCEAFGRGPLVTVAVVEARTIYQIADPLLSEIPGGALTSLGPPSPFQRSTWASLLNQIQFQIIKKLIYKGKMPRWQVC